MPITTVSRPAVGCAWTPAAGQTVSVSSVMSSSETHCQRTRISLTLHEQIWDVSFCKPAEYHPPANIADYELPIANLPVGSPSAISWVSAIPGSPTPSGSGLVRDPAGL